MISYRKLAMRVLGHSPVSAARTARRSTAKRAAALALTAALGRDDAPRLCGYMVH